MFANFGLKFALVWKGFQIFAQGALSQKLKNCQSYQRKFWGVEKTNKKAAVII